MIRIVLDANQFVSALLNPLGNSAQILDLVKIGKLKLLVSPDILSETQRVLLYPKLRKFHRLTPQQIDDFLKIFTRVAIFTPGKIKVNVIKDDPTDNKYLECALEAKADFIISGDHHLTDLVSFNDIRITHPGIFLVLCKTIKEL